MNQSLGVFLLHVLLSLLLSGIRFQQLAPLILSLVVILLLCGVWVLVSFMGGVSGLHRRLCDFIHAVVVHRLDDAFRGWRNWVREDLLIHPLQVASS